MTKAPYFNDATYAFNGRPIVLVVSLLTMFCSNKATCDLNEEECLSGYFNDDLFHDEMCGQKW